jgi:hypothetical protein
VVLPEVVVQGLIAATEADPNAQITVDLPSQTVTGPDGAVHHFEIDPFNKRCLLDIAQKLRAEGGPGGTLVILGAGRLLDVPWETLFPQFERVVLYDADSSIVPFVEPASSKVQCPFL